MKKNGFVRVILFFVPALIFSCGSDTTDPNEDLKRDMSIIDSYLQASGVDQNKILSDNVTGVRFVFEEYGQGIAVSPTQKVEYDVVGRVLSGGSVGLPFINNLESKKIEDVRPEGLNYGIRSILQGTLVTLYVPARYAYGSSGNSTLGIPADAVLRYDINLKKVERTITQQTQFEQDTLTIKNFLIDRGVENAVQHPSGFWYTVDIEGSGNTPTPYSTVTFEYELKNLAAPNQVIETNTLQNSFIWGLVQGLRIGFQLMEENATYTFYLPSGMCYGSSGTGSIPANANLIFKIKLVSVQG